MFRDLKRFLNRQIKIGALAGKWGIEQERLLNQSAIRMYALMTMIAADILPTKSSPIFLHVRHDYEKVVKAAANIYHLGQNLPIYLEGSEGQHRDDPFPNGKPGVINGGFNFWYRQLRRLHVPSDDIIPTGPSYNTPDETLELLKLARYNNWDSVIIIGNSYQMLRIVLGTIQWMKKENFWLKCHFVMPSGYEWTQKMRGPQDSEEGDLFDQFWIEYKRIIEYQIKGDLCSLQEAMNYLCWGRNLIKNNVLPVNLLSEASVTETNWVS